MLRKILSLGLSLVLILFCFPLFAQTPQESLDEISITTYYPSPYGTYNELSTNKFAVGYLTSTDQPTREGAIRLKPQVGDPATWVAEKPGEMAYSSTDGYLYVDNGSKWVAQGGGTSSTYFLACSCPTHSVFVDTASAGAALNGAVYVLGCTGESSYTCYNRVCSGSIDSCYNCGYNVTPKICKYE